MPRSFFCYGSVQDDSHASISVTSKIEVTIFDSSELSGYAFFLDVLRDLLNQIGIVHDYDVFMWSNILCFTPWNSIYLFMSYHLAITRMLESLRTCTHGSVLLSRAVLHVFVNVFVVLLMVISVLNFDKATDTCINSVFLLCVSVILMHFCMPAYPR